MTKQVQTQKRPSLTAKSGRGNQLILKRAPVKALLSGGNIEEWEPRQSAAAQPGKRFFPANESADANLITY